MKFAHFFIDRPVFASVISIVIMIVGGIAYALLPVAQYPDIAPPTVVISASYAGANAKTVADTIAAPIEQQLTGVENMLYMSSQCTNDGQLRLTATFKLGTDLDIAQVQVQNRVAIAEPQLPEEVRRVGVTVKKSSPDITLVVQIYSDEQVVKDDQGNDVKDANGKVVTKAIFDPLYVSNFGLLQVRDVLATLPGVGDIFLFGARDYSMRLWLDPQKLASRSITAGDVVRAVREQNVQVAAGVVGAQPLPAGSNSYQLTVNALGRLTEEQEFKDIVVKTGTDGRITYLRDVARVERAAADYTASAYLNGKPAVAIPIFQLPGTNSIDTADAVRDTMKRLESSQSWPKGLKYHIPYDTTVFVRESVADVKKTLAEAVLLVVIVVLVFLQSWRATIIPLLAVPVSLIGTCAIMKLMGFSLNNLSLFGMVLAIGIVVDDAIVVVENVERWIEKGLAPRDATYKAMDEVTGAVIAIAFGLTAVFIPVAFVPGISGQFYRQFALTISISTLLSAFNSLTLSPAMAALLLRPHGAKKDWLTKLFDFTLGWFFRLFNRALGAVTNGYAGSLRRIVRVAALVLVGYVGLLGLTYFGFNKVPTGFIPPQDSGYLVVNLSMPDAAAFDRTDEVMRRMAKIANETEGVEDTFAITGYSFLTGTNQSNAGAMFVVLNPFEKRKGNPNLTADALQGRLMGAYSSIQEGFPLVIAPPPVRGIGQAGGFKLMIRDAAGQATPQELAAVTSNVIAAAAQDKRVACYPSNFRADVPQLYANVNREKVKAQDVQVTDVFDALQVYLGGLYVNDFNFLGRTYKVMAQADTPFRAKPEDINQLQTRNRSGAMVPLGALVDIKEITGPDRIQRYNLKTSADIIGSAAPGVSSGTAIEVMEKIVKEQLPPGYDFEWTELAYQEKVASTTVASIPLTALIFGLSVLLVFLVHSAEYESFAMSSAIILIVPMCLLSAIFGVWLRGMENNIFTQIGFVVLAGLSAKNAVLIVEFAKQQEEQGKGYVDAAIESARNRLRPILMTSFAFILGVLPLVIAKGAGAEMRQVLGTAVFFGMIGVTFFGLFLTPVFYVSIRWAMDKVFGKQTFHAHGEHGADPVPVIPVTAPHGA